ncbi:hypothetical protein BDP27DRAFT_391530 [Rhodocollybia butyracea]|uniref:Uncharacterized protein n=1 Tax=Rhodocollybia butyracea TaxID=206335 RepID=A0A9P5PBR6_9AGAR|nr:hypothetical protein BDP27DRAFT_391530 [Rhodocollybia butyracea]
MSSARVPCSSPQLLSAQQQTNNTLVPNTRTMNTANASPLLISSEVISSKRARTTSTSSIDTIRIGTGKKKNTSSKKRARASEPSTTSESNLSLLQNIRRSRPRKLSTETVVAVAFPSFADDNTETPRNDAISKKKDERKVTPPKLNPGHASPSVAVSTSSVADALESSPSAIRHAPPPPIAGTVRSRVISMKAPSSRPTSPAYRGTLPPHYRVSGFEPLPTHLQDWQPSSVPYCMSDDEGSLSDTDALSAWKDVRPGISDMDITISFSKKQPFFDVWDLPDE